MPIYQYKCNKCGFLFEKFNKVENRDISTCPHCTSNNVSRKFLPTAIIFNGKGFYKTDNKKKDKGS
jgi:putative FmdB family regulatory protein